jgi:hypothetical protein
MRRSIAALCIAALTAGCDLRADQGQLTEAAVRLSTAIDQGVDRATYDRLVLELATQHSLAGSPQRAKEAVEAAEGMQILWGAAGDLRELPEDFQAQMVNLRIVTDGRTAASYITRDTNLAHRCRTYGESDPDCQLRLRIFEGWITSGLGTVRSKLQAMTTQ